MRSKNIYKTLLCTVAIASPVLHLQLYFSGNWYSLFHSYSIGMFFGIISYTYFLNCLIVSSRIKLIDRIFGHDKVLYFHGYLALAAFTSAIVHYIFKFIYLPEISVQTALGTVSLTIFAAIITITLLLMVKNLLRSLPIIHYLRSLMGRFIKVDYSRLKQFHNITALASAIVAVHVLLSTSTQENFTRMSLMGAWALVALILFVYHKLIRPLIQSSNASEIIAVTKLTEDIVEITTHPFKTGKMFRAGQFGYFRIKSAVCGSEEHPFTIASSQGASVTSLLIKNLGDYTSRLALVPPGTKITMDGPYGIFTPKQDTTPHLFIAGGIGITPFLSILSTWDRATLTTPTTLIWSTHNPADMTHKTYFEELENRSAAFTFIQVFTARPTSSQKSTKINRSLLKSVLEKSDTHEMKVFLCGPQGLLESAGACLMSMGIKRHQIHHERFAF